MRRVRGVFAVSLLGLVGLWGCETTREQVRPPKPPEEFRAPPEDDPRYSRPMEYPKELMDQDMLMKKARDAAKAASNKPGLSMPGRPPGGF
jgi:hypothetical protein